jgi:hypothetical protein
MGFNDDFVVFSCLVYGLVLNDSRRFLVPILLHPLIVFRWRGGVEGVFAGEDDSY